MAWQAVPGVIGFYPRVGGAQGEAGRAQVGAPWDAEPSAPALGADVALSQQFLGSPLRSKPDSEPCPSEALELIFSSSTTSSSSWFLFQPFLSLYLQFVFNANTGHNRRKSL